MPATYEPIATTTLGSAASSISFSSIPGTYTDLRMVLVGTGTTNNTYFLYRFNSDSSSLYSTTRLSGNGSTTRSIRNSGTGLLVTYEALLSDTIPSMWTLDVFSYAGSTNKTALATISADRNGSGQTEMAVGLYRSTTAISSVSAVMNSSTFAAGTTATLYGILKA
jgi:hypothetical protein